MKGYIDMNYSDYRFTLDVQVHQAQVSVPVTLNDTARRLYIGFTDGRKPYTIPNGCRAVFAALKPDGKPILNDCIIENNKTVVYKFSKNTTNAEGTVDCEIRLYDKAGRELTSPQFIIVVDKRVVRDEEIPLSESESTTLDSIISSEFERVEAEEKRKELYQFLSTSGGVIVSEDEPQEELGNVWIDSSDDKEEVFLLDNTDIVQELSEDEDKIPSVALLNNELKKIGKGIDGATFIPNLATDGTLSWTNDKGLENPAPVNIFTEEVKNDFINRLLNEIPQAEDKSV